MLELPDNNKDDALQFLAHIIEAIPSLPTGIDVVGPVIAKETLEDFGARKRLGQSPCTRAV